MTKATKEQLREIKKMAFNYTNKEIAEKMNLNEKTIRNYKKKMFNYEIKTYGDFNRIKNEMKPILLSKDKLLYLCGFIDGEGSLFISKTNHKNGKYISITPVLSITNTDKNIITIISKWLKGVGIITIKKDKREKNKICYNYLKTGFGILPLLNIIIPHLIVRKQQAIMLKKFIELRLKDKWLTSYSKREISLYETIKKLNKRGN